MKKSRYIIYILFSLAFVLRTEYCHANGPLKAATGNAGYSMTDRDLSGLAGRALNSARDQEAFFHENFKIAALHYRIQQRVNRPDILIPGFLTALNRLSPAQKVQVFSTLKGTYSAQTESVQNGISGKISVMGDVPTAEVQILVFDDHGYFAGLGQVSIENNNYLITGLASGSYYVMTQSEDYVDELYNNIPIPAADLTSWRSAEKVIVSSGIVENIDFDLHTGATLSGTIWASDGTTLLTDENVTFSITRTTIAATIFEKQVTLNEGQYKLIIPYSGDLKISATIEGFQKTWLPNQQDWSNGQTVTIPSLDSRVENVNFQMAPDPQALAHGSITGSVFPSLFGLAYAIDLSDTSFAGLGFSVLFGNYEIKDLTPGKYLVFGNDYFGNLIGAGNYVGEYYNGKLDPGQADPVQVNGGQVTENINFTLEQGGSISGSISSYDGTPVDSLMILCFHADLGAAGQDPFLTRLQIAAAMTDKKGQYSIKGLPTADYILRTLSKYSFNPSISNLSELIITGKHAGKIVDEYYQDIYNILQLKKAQRVHVDITGQTKNIDFVLAQPCFFTGTLTDAVTNAPDTSMTLVAMQDTSANPFLAPTQYEVSGAYKLGPLPAGKYKILALSGFKSNSIYLTEFFDGKHSYEDADILELAPPQRDGIHFTINPGGIIQGFIDLKSGDDYYPAGADTLDMMPVVAFHAETGLTANYNFIQFNGGYRIDRLPPGQYKIMVMPLLAPYATTFVGGGASFNDPMTESISLDYGRVEERNIELQSASGSISGNVLEFATNTPLSNVMVVAYDSTGHSTGCAMTDFDWISGTATTQNGSFTITGLRPGKYYVRTWSLSSLSGILELFPLVLNLGQNFDLIGLLQGGLPGISLDLSTHQDRWYPAIPARMTVTLDELIIKASSYGMPSPYENALFPIYLPLPFADDIPSGAESVSLQDQALTGIQLFLPPGSLDDNIHFDTQVNRETIADRFSTGQNYPNPFNPKTALTIYTVKPTKVTIDIYDALGRRINTLVDHEISAGEHSIIWSGDDSQSRTVASGIYFARIFADQNYVKTIKMLFIK
jgi:hypothetical protein